MKRVLLISLSFFVFISNLLACTFAPTSFCQTASMNDERLVISGIITEVDEDGINVDIIQILQGQEDRSNIRIWDGTDFDCNGLFSMAAADFGLPGDTIITILPEIQKVENSWDVIGDYRRPDTYSESTYLRVLDGIARGLITGDYNYYATTSIYSFDYQALISSWLKEDGCDGITSTQELVSKKAISISPNPASEYLAISHENFNTNFAIRILTTQGKEVLSTYSNGNNIPVSHLAPGMYFIIIEDERKDIITERFIKN